MMSPAGATGFEYSLVKIPTTLLAVARVYNRGQADAWAAAASRGHAFEHGEQMH